MYKLHIYQSMLSILISNHWKDAGCKPVKKMLHMWCFLSLAKWYLVKTKKDITHFIFNSLSVIKYLKIYQGPFWCLYYIAVTLHSNTASEIIRISAVHSIACSTLTKHQTKNISLVPCDWIKWWQTDSYNKGQVMWIAGSSWVAAIQDPT